MQIKRKEWDSDFFNINIAEVYIKALDSHRYTLLRSQLVNEQIDLLYLYTLDSTSTDFLVNCKVPLADTKVSFFKFPDNTVTSISDAIQSYKTDRCYPSLLKLVLESGKFSRFNDPKFRNNGFERLYTTWLDKSIDKSYADDVLVYRNSNSDIEGFITYSTHGTILKIGLIAVDENSRFKGIGKELLNCIESISVKLGIDQIFVDTQETNSGACKFYSANGYVIHAKQPIFHLWLNDDTI